MNLNIVKVENPEELNFILGQSHFIKTVEDIHEMMVQSIPGALFGLAFCEASGPCLVRSSGNDELLIKLAEKNIMNIASGHSFVLFMKGCFPINILSKLKMVPEVVRIFCATANPVEVIVGETEQGKGILGVIDGFSPKGIENNDDKVNRREFLRNIGYKL
jgi:adenosine/AMP kinase